MPCCDAQERLLKIVSLVAWPAVLLLMELYKSTVFLSSLGMSSPRCGGFLYILGTAATPSTLYNLPTSLGADLYSNQ